MATACIDQAPINPSTDSTAARQPRGSSAALPKNSEPHQTGRSPAVAPAVDHGLNARAEAHEPSEAQEAVARHAPQQKPTAALKPPGSRLYAAVAASFQQSCVRDPSELQKKFDVDPVIRVHFTKQEVGMGLCSFNGIALMVQRRNAIGHEVGGLAFMGFKGKHEKATLGQLVFKEQITLKELKDLTKLVESRKEFPTFVRNCLEFVNEKKYLLHDGKEKAIKDWDESENVYMFVYKSVASLKLDIPFIVQSSGGHGTLSNYEIVEDGQGSCRIQPALHNKKDAHVTMTKVTKKKR